MRHSLLYRQRYTAVVILFFAIIGLFSLTNTSEAQVASNVIAFDLVDSTSQNLVNYNNPYTGAFSSPGDGFQIYQRGVSTSIPFDVLDDSLVSYPPDSQGIITDNNTDKFFGATDTINAENSGDVSATWVFDIGNVPNLSLSIDVGAMGDFESADFFVWEYSIDGGTTETAFASTVDEDASLTYTMAGGSTFTYNDPMLLNGEFLTNNLTTFTAPIIGTGNQLELTLTVNTNGGGEGMAFQNIVIKQPIVAFDLVDSTSQNLVSYNNPYTGAFSSPGDGFQIYQRGVSTSIPFDVLDDSLVSYPPDSQGIITDNNTDKFFGATDTINAENSGDVSATWVFDIGNVPNLSLSIDVGAMGDFESADFFTWSYSIDGATAQTAFASTVDENASLTYTMAGGSTFTYNDPMLLNGEFLTNNLTTFTVPIIGTGNQLELTLTVNTNGGGEGMAFQSIVIREGDVAPPPPPPEPELVRVHQVQGDGASVAITNDVIVEAVVIGDYQEDDQLDGFFIQEEDVDADTNSATSEGIFVYCGFDNCGSFAPINVGDIVRVTGTPTEFFGMSQIEADTIEVLSTGNTLPTPASISLPITAPDIDAFYEQYEGMLVSYTNTLVVSEYFQLARYGEIILYGDARPYQFTDENTPDVAGYSAHLDTLARNRVILDDDDNTQNSPLPDGVLYHPQPDGFGVGTQGLNYFRGGDTVSGLTGVLHWSFAGQSGTDAWRIRPVAELPITFTPVNTREASPASVGGNVTVASLNVLNYFTSIDGGDCSANPATQCRGADSEAELARQTLQTVTALAAMNADVVGLVEIENNGTAVATLVDELNAVVGAGTYAYINTGVIGTDAITTAVIYKPAVVSPIGMTAILDDPAFTDPTGDGTQRSRPAVTQSFEVTDVNNPDVGAVFTVVVNHLKSKGSGGCNGLDCDQNDGAGAFNETRRLGAEYLVNTWIPSNPTGISDPDYIILGDLNAYASETPISAIVNAGYTDLIDATTAGAGYSYVFDGQLGYLDYALTNSSMTPQVTGVTEWHVNADEVPVFDYNDTVQDPAEASFEAESSGNELFAGDGFRNSDHDPVIVGLDLLPNEPPIVDAGEDITIDEGSTANFNGSFTDADSPVGHTISWDFGATTLIASQTYDDGPATIEVTLSVTDEFGATGTDSLIVTVENVAPTASLAALYPDPTFQGEFNTFVFSNQFDPSTADTNAGFDYAIDCTVDNMDFIRTDTASIDCRLVDAGDVVVTGIIQDKDGGLTMYTVTVQVLSPVDGYDYIRQLIGELQAEAGLNNGQTNALTTKVDNSESQYLRGNDAPAINQLQALITQLQDLANEGVITEEQRATLANAVQRLAVSIGSGY